MKRGRLLTIALALAFPLMAITTSYGGLVVEGDKILSDSDKMSLNVQAVYDQKALPETMLRINSVFGRTYSDHGRCYFAVTVDMTLPKGTTNVFYNNNGKPLDGLNYLSFALTGDAASSTFDSRLTYGDKQSIPLRRRQDVTSGTFVSTFYTGDMQGNVDYDYVSLFSLIGATSSSVQLSCAFEFPLLSSYNEVAPYSFTSLKVILGTDVEVGL